tara:strand:- start:4104 stop:4334 length:231 start_codon:yes stop_codon:yes gene_type:complete
MFSLLADKIHLVFTSFDIHEIDQKEDEVTHLVEASTDNPLMYNIHAGRIFCQMTGKIKLEITIERNGECKREVYTD